MITAEQIKQYRLLTDWFISVLEHVKEEDGNKTVAENTNSLEWLAGHLVFMRSRNIVRLGQQIEPYKHMNLYLDTSQSQFTLIPFDKNKKYPFLQESMEEWSTYSEVLINLLEKADDSVLKTEISLTEPTGGNTLGDLLVSTVLHEAYHIGQMSIIRRALGYNPMYWFHRA